MKAFSLAQNGKYMASCSTNGQLILWQCDNFFTATYASELNLKKVKEIQYNSRYLKFTSQNEG